MIRAMAYKSKAKNILERNFRWRRRLIELIHAPTGKPKRNTVEPFKVDLGEKDLANVFATCVFCFNCTIEAAPSGTEALYLSVLRLRLTRWGEAVNIYESPALSFYNPGPGEIHAVRRDLVDILTLFEPGSSTTNASASYPTGGGKQKQELLRALEDITCARFPRGENFLGSQYLGCGRWSQWKLERAASSISHLETLFGWEHLRELCAGERLKTNDEGALQLLMAVVRDLDPWMTDNPRIPHNPLLRIVAGDLTAAAFKHHETVVFEPDETVVRMLLDKGEIDIDSKDEDGRTPLSWAAGNGYKTVVRMLLDKGEIDVDSKDEDGRTPLSWGWSDTAVVGHLLRSRGRGQGAA